MSESSRTAPESLAAALGPLTLSLTALSLLALIALVAMGVRTQAVPTGPAGPELSGVSLAFPGGTGLDSSSRRSHRAALVHLDRRGEAVRGPAAARRPGSSPLLIAPLAGGWDMGGLLAPGFWKTPVFWLMIPVLALLFLYSTIVVHACSHYSAFRSRRLNTVLGNILSACNLYMFKEFQALHVLHHDFTNDLEKDPHAVPPGCGWLRFCGTQYPYLVAFTFTPFYRRHRWKKNFEGVDLDSPEMRRHDRIGKLFGTSGRRVHALWTVPICSIFGGLSLIACAGVLVFGTPFLALMLGWWLLPWYIGQVLVGDFNWRGHVGLPKRTDYTHETYTGQDSRSYYLGVWKFINFVTTGFYLHREHHMWPRQCIFVAQDAEMRRVQETEEADELAAEGGTASPA